MAAGLQVGDGDDSVSGGQAEGRVRGVARLAEVVPAVEAAPRRRRRRRRPGRPASRGAVGAGARVDRLRHDQLTHRLDELASVVLVQRHAAHLTRQVSERATCNPLQLINANVGRGVSSCGTLRR